MVTLIHLVRVALLLMLAMLTVSFVMGMGTSTTGWVEKVALGGLIVVCYVAAAQINDVAAKLQERRRATLG